MSTLQERLKDVLNGAPPNYASDDSEAEAVNSIFEMLQKAEADLSAAQDRVDHLKWTLAKARDYQV